MYSAPKESTLVVASSAGGSRASGGLLSLLKSRRESVSLPFPAQGPPTVCGFLPLQSQLPLVESFSHPVPLTLTLLPPSSTVKDPSDYTGPTQVIWDIFPIVRPCWNATLIPSAIFNSPLPYNMHKLWRLGHEYLWGPFYRPRFLRSVTWQGCLLSLVLLSTVLWSPASAVTPERGTRSEDGKRRKLIVYRWQS